MVKVGNGRATREGGRFKNLRLPESHFSNLKKSEKKVINFAQVKVHIPTM